MANSNDAATLSHDVDAHELGSIVALRYVARAGLLPELSRQTYDTFPKAVREAVLNAFDAEATRIDIDFADIEASRKLTVRDDGVGMSMDDFCEQFMSLGGSSKFGDGARFGRIGIGSLALLQYAESAVVETKRAGTATITRARIQHPWNLGRADRRSQLGDMPAGTAEELAYVGDPGDHFTAITLENVNQDVWAIGQDPTAFYGLIESLRRMLPLPWSDGRLTAALEQASPELVSVLKEHVGNWSAPVYLHSSWEREVELGRRFYGDDGTGAEDWSGPPVPLLKKVRVQDGEGPSRQIIIAGFMLNQKRATPDWTGLTARVQNVAVEEHSFFDVATDPGFRKYISGEVWLLGAVDRERLINIDRSSFNRECADYHAVQRVMARAIVDFKSKSVQRPQRQKVAVRRVLEDHVKSLKAISTVAQAAAAAHGGTLPASDAHRKLTDRHGVAETLAKLDVELVVDEERPGGGYELDLSDDGTRVKATVSPATLAPSVPVGETEYLIEYADGTLDEPPVVIRNRPRSITFNTGHPAFATGDRARKFEMALALELAYLMGADDPEMIYTQMLGFLEAI